jgi:16S rRNA (adenine1518-N6/adenine1519-N6)-dimethyltransferase
VKEGNVESPREILKRHGLHAKYSWGQNFLGDEGALREIAEALELREGEPVVELGPGLGHLTRFLAATGAKVTAVEKDRDMLAVLEKEAIPGVRVVSGNAATVDFAAVAGVAEVAVVGNLPYHLTSSILFRVLEQRARVSRAVFPLQKEVVERLAAEPGTRDYGLLSVLLGLHFDVEHVFTLEAHLFHPPPKVDSAVVRLTRLKAPRAPLVSEERFIRVVKAGFAQRRKTLFNSLKSDRTLATPEQWAKALETAGIDPMRRAETLAPAEFAALERALGPMSE